jgi:hypothetical protein
LDQNLIIKELKAENQKLQDEMPTGVVGDIIWKQVIFTSFGTLNTLISMFRSVY